MAKLFKHSTILLVLVGFLALAKAKPGPNPRHDDHHTKIKTEVTVKDKDGGDDCDEGGNGGGSGGSGGSGGIGLGGLGGGIGGGLGGGLGGIGGGLGTGGGSGGNGGGVIAVVGTGGSGGSGGDGGCNCKCKDSKLKEFAHKFALLLRTYTSTELGPELQRIGKKFVEYIITYLAKEKPAQMDKFQCFLQGSAKVTENAISKCRS